MKKVAITILAILFIAGCATKTPISKPEKLAACYHGIVGDSNSVFTVVKQNGNKVSGSMAFVFAQKDSSYGTYEGAFVDGKLKVTYTFWSEGLQSVGDYEFIKNGENFTGQGYIYIPATDCATFLKR